MRLIVEVSDSERDALRKLCASLDGVAYSVLVRTLLRMCLDGTLPRPKLLAALAAPRAVLNVTLTEAPKPAKVLKKDPTGIVGWDAPRPK